MRIKLNLPRKVLDIMLSRLFKNQFYASGNTTRSLKVINRFFFNIISNSRILKLEIN